MKNTKSLPNQHEYAGFLKNAIAINGSVSPKVFSKVIFMIVYSSFISYLYFLYPSISLPIGPFEYAGFIMGLILVFRINSGYDRWWEARKIWGSIVNHSRNLAIIILHYSTTQDESWKIKVTNYIAAIPYLIKNHLRNENNYSGIKNLIDQETMNKLKLTKHQPNFLSSLIAKEIHSACKNNELDSFSFMQAEEKRALIIECQGACERILNTPIPFVMAVKARRFILLFLMTLPFAIVHDYILLSPLITGIVSYALFSLDQIGIELQNPFSESNLSHLPLNEICKSIKNNIKELSEV